jgi:hypothetical protein
LRAHDVTALGLLLSCAVHASHVLATEAPARFQITLVGQALTKASLQTRVASWFDRNAAVRIVAAQRVEREHVLEPPAVGVVYVWVTLERENLARFYFSTRDSEHDAPRYLVSDVEFGTALDEVGSERLSQYVHSAALAFRDGVQQSQRREVERTFAAQQPAKSIPAQTPSNSKAPTPLASTVTATVTAGYRVHAAGREGVLQGATVGAGVLARGDWEARADVQYLLPHQFDASTSSVQVSGLSAQATLEHALPLGAALHALVSASAGTLVLATEARSQGDEFIDDELRPFLGTGFGVEAELWRLRLAVRAEPRIALHRARYVAEENGVRSELFRSTLLQLGFSVAVALPARSAE